LSQPALSAACVAQIEHHPAGVAFVRERGRLRLEGDRIADILRRRLGLSEVPYQHSSRDRNSGSRQDLL